ncbi:MAG: glutamate-ammonia-ligase adenylyltransferase [Acidimicrobiales bacterium]|nr:glutamate-ammonia-ligase adenylyltransferase [Acidimicrobiales bacterium]
MLAQLIERSAAPAWAGVAAERIGEADPGIADRLRADDALAEAFVTVASASRALTELCLSDPAALDVLSQLDLRVALEVDDVDALRRWKRLELLRIAARDLLGMDDLVTVGRALANLADDVLGAACRLAGAMELAVIGMGKLGGCELNYASDIDVLFVAGDAEAGERQARAVMEIARSCFRVDADLRPEGRDGPLVRTLGSYESYWDRWAHTWEFQALLKARPVAGDEDLGAAFLAAARTRVWDRAFDADDLRAVRSMKARAEGELARRHLTEREIKRGRGGIRDVEFAVQLLQLVHGRQDPGIRSPNTLSALSELAAAGYVGSDDAEALDRAYRYLRAVEHRLQLVDEQQVHAVPTDRGAVTRLARVMGYRDSPEGDAATLLTEDLRRHQTTVRSIYERLFFRPLLEAFAVGPGGTRALSVEAAETRLTAFGFTDVERTRVALRELAGGLTRSSRLMQQMLPLVLGWLSESPDPDLGLLGLRRLSSGEQRTTELVTAFRESPEVARRLCLLLGTSRLFADTLEHNPDELLSLGDPEGLVLRSADELVAGASAALEWRTSPLERQRGLYRYRQREELHIAARDVLGLDGDDAVPITGAQLTALAEAAVASAMEAVASPLPFAVVAMGRFGGAELSYASDLDVLFVYDGSTAEDFGVAEQTAESLLGFLAGRTPAPRIYTVDLGLRPEGKQGPLARSLDGYRTYYERWALMWERQALLRARPVAGEVDVGRRFMELIEPHVWRPMTDDDVREVRRMKARIERERIPAGDDPQFHLKLGRGSLSDIEFTAQLLQLQHGVRSPGTMAALEALTAAGALDPDDAATLSAAYRFCERTRNRWYLVKGSPGDALPTQGDDLARLARSLGTTGGELREQYRRVTRRARQVVERVFYGK